MSIDAKGYLQIEKNHNNINFLIIFSFYIFIAKNFLHIYCIERLKIFEFNITLGETDGIKPKIISIRIV